MSKRSAALSILDTAGIYAVAGVLLIVGTLVSPDFLTADNLLNINPV